MSTISGTTDSLIAYATNIVSYTVATGVGGLVCAASMVLFAALLQKTYDAIFNEPAPGSLDTKSAESRKENRHTFRVMAGAVAAISYLFAVPIFLQTLKNEQKYIEAVFQGATLITSLGVGMTIVATMGMMLWKSGEYVYNWT